MKKHVLGLIVAIAIVVTVLGAMSKPSISFTSSVKGCAETEKGMATRAFNEEREPSIAVFGNKLIYDRAISHLCCRKVEMKREIAGSKINIYEVWSGAGCRCICFSEIGATLENLPSGTYSVSVYEKGTNPDGSAMEQVLIISKEIKV